MRRHPSRYELWKGWTDMTKKNSFIDIARLIATSEI